MPPRYAYWTILIGSEPTSFRAGAQEDLLPTLNRLKQKHPEAKMMWWQNGKLWASRLDAQEAMRARGEMGRRGDVRQGGTFGHRDRTADREPRSERNQSGKLEWKPKGTGEGKPLPERKPRRESKLEWKPKGKRQERRPLAARGGDRPSRDDRKPEWRPRSQEWRPKAQDYRQKPHDSRPRAKAKLEWQPKSQSSEPKRKWIPKKDFKSTAGTARPRDKNWRPGGEHRDPRQKYKDAKKAKWTRFKQTIRKRWDAKQPGPKKRRDDE